MCHSFDCLQASRTVLGASNGRVLLRPVAAVAEKMSGAAASQFSQPAGNQNSIQLHTYTPYLGSKHHAAPASQSSFRDRYLAQLHPALATCRVLEMRHVCLVAMPNLTQ